MNSHVHGAFEHLRRRSNASLHRGIFFLPTSTSAPEQLGAQYYTHTLLKCDFLE